MRHRRRRRGEEEEGREEGGGVSDLRRVNPLAAQGWGANHAVLALFGVKKTKKVRVGASSLRAPCN